MFLTQALALALSVSPAAAVYKGFNYGSTNPDGSYKDQTDFQNEFQTAKGLVGTSGFTSARLYTMIQGGTTSTPISALEAAIQEETSLLLGLWASGDTFDDEIAALTAAIKDHGNDLTKLVVGISVGSEDLYRDSEMGMKADAGVGTGPDTIINYIKTVRSTIAGTALSSVPVGHVDTWTAWANSSNTDVISQCDWLGIDAYPYFQNTMSNDISSGASLLQEAINNVKANAGDKPLWITETGWPVSGKTENLGVPSIANAKTYWDDVGCDMLFDKMNTWWYILQDADGSSTPNPSFGIVGTSLTTTPLFNLTCPAVTSSTSASSSATSSPGQSSSSPSSATATAGSASGSAGGSTASSAAGSSGSSGSGSSGSGATGSSGTSTSTGKSPAFTGGASGVSASVTGVVAALFALIVAF